MNYYVDIIDTIDDAHITIYESAAKDGIQLTYRGNDAIDELNIVGSVLSFNMNVPRTNDTDAVFIDLFTGDEQRYRVELRRDQDDFLIWQGFLLPDSYSEPYTGSTYFVDFSATDGLGRIKGKYLTDDFYKEEKTVVEIIAACLLLTGLEMPLIMAPGIDNKLEKDWNNVFINTSLYVKKDKKEDAYKILEALVNDTVSCLYQHLGHWYFEGLNKHTLETYGAKLYDAFGIYVQDQQVLKAVKTGVNRFTDKPLVTMMPPFNEIEITYDAPGIYFPETLFEEQNEGWIADDSITGEILSTDWYGYNGFNAMAIKPKYNVSLSINSVATFDPTKYISLKNKIYLKKGLKVKLIMKFSTDPYADYYKDISIAGGYRDNNFNYEVKLNSTVLYTNLGTTVSSYEAIKFGTDDKVELGFEFIADENGLLDIVLYQPFGNRIDAAMKGVFLDEFEISEIGFDEDGYISDLINEEYTIDKEIKLSLTDGAAGLGPVFRLGRLNENNPLIYNTIDVPVSYGRVFEGVNYAIVSLQGANLIADNIKTVYMNGVIIENLDVIYNLNDGEEMVVVSDLLYGSGDKFQVRQYKIKDYSLDRTHWEQWTDSVYQVERKRFTNAVIGVYRRLFDIPKPKIDGNVRGPILFGDLLRFNYLELQNYCIVNTRLNFDNGYSDVTMVKAGYAQAQGGNLNPFVDCGPDIYITKNQTEAFIDATAFDPDGTIVSYLWIKLSGPAGDIMSSAITEDLNLSNLTGDAYEYQLTVTDNNGATASCSVKVLRRYDYETTFELIECTEEIYEDDGDPNNPFTYIEKDCRYAITIDPVLPESAYINFNYNVNLIKRIYSDLPDFENAGVQIYKNGVKIASYFTVEDSELDFLGVLNFSKDDVIEILLSVVGFYPSSNSDSPVATFQLLSGAMFNTPGNLIELPVEVKLDI